MCNLVGLIPLPFGDDHQLSFYAATGNLNVTVTLALFTFVFTHYAGIHEKGAVGYVKGWVIPPRRRCSSSSSSSCTSSASSSGSSRCRSVFSPTCSPATPSWRVFFAMALVFQSYLIAVVLQAGSVTLYLFEIFVAAIQAFIFAILSAVYVGSALEDEE